MSSRNEAAIGELYDRYGRLAYSIKAAGIRPPARGGRPAHEMRGEAAA